MLPQRAASVCEKALGTNLSEASRSNPKSNPEPIDRCVFVYSIKELIELAKVGYFMVIDSHQDVAGRTRRSLHIPVAPSLA